MEIFWVIIILLIFVIDCCVVYINVCIFFVVGDLIVCKIYNVIYLLLIWMFLKYCCNFFDRLNVKLKVNGFWIFK